MDVYGGIFLFSVLKADKQIYDETKVFIIDYDDSAADGGAGTARHPEAADGHDA